MESAPLNVIDGDYKPRRMVVLERLLNHRYLDATPAQANSHDLEWNDHVAYAVGDALIFLKQRGVDAFTAERLVAGLIILSGNRDDNASSYLGVLSTPSSYIDDLAVFCKASAALKDFVGRDRLPDLITVLRPLAILQVMLFEMLFEYLNRSDASAAERAICNRLKHETGGISSAHSAFALLLPFRNDFDRQVTGTQEHIYELLQVIRGVTIS